LAQQGSLQHQNCVLCQNRKPIVQASVTPPVLVGEYPDTSRLQPPHSSQTSKSFDPGRGGATSKPPGTVHSHPQPQQHSALTQHALLNQYPPSSSHPAAPQHRKHNASPPQISQDPDTTNFVIPRKANGKRQKLSRQTATRMPHVYSESVASSSHAPLGSGDGSSIEARSTS
jgi:hypothetical protein